MREGAILSALVEPKEGYAAVDIQLAGLEEAERLVRDYAEKFVLDWNNERIMQFAEKIAGGVIEII